MHMFEASANNRGQHHATVRDSKSADNLVHSHCMRLSRADSSDSAPLAVAHDECRCPITSDSILQHLWHPACAKLPAVHVIS